MARRSREVPYAPAQLWHLQDRRLAVEPEAVESEAGRSAPALSLEDVRRLSPRQRLVILGLFWGELAPRELAEALDLRPEALRACVRRALAALRRRAPAPAARPRSSA